MQKVLALLEGWVEWIALGIAVAYLGWAAYAYLVVDPVAKSLDGTMVNPGNVDTFIEGHAAEALKDKMNDVQVPSFVVDDSNQIFDRWLNMQSMDQPALASADFDYSPFDSGSLINGPQNRVVAVNQLPTLPAAEPALVAAALNTLAPPAGAAQANGKNVRLVVAGFTIPFDALFKQWDQSFGGQPPKLNPADFQVLQVITYRSEKIGGVWTDGEQVSTLDNGLPPYPQAGNKVAAETYLIALAKQQNVIVAPAYPTTVSGPTWKDPIQYLPTGSNAPTTPAPDQGGAMLLPDAHQAMIVNTQYRGGGGGGPGGPPPGFGGPGGPRFGPGPVVPPPSAPTPPPAATAVPPAPGTVDPVVALASPNPPAITPVEQPKVNLLALPVKSPDLFLYVIDPTAEPGKTYRYQIVYKVLNPLFNKAPQHAINQAWVNQFDLVAAKSGFSPEITVPQQTYFYCAKPQGANSKMAYPFEVFTWANGKWQKDTFNVNIGDPIGGTDGGIDYSTGYSFVDKRQSKSNTKTLITLVDLDGTSEIRDAGRDSTSKEHQEKTQWVDQQTTAGGNIPTAPAGPAAGGPTGAPPPGIPFQPPGNGN